MSQSFGGYLDYYGEYSFENYLDSPYYAPALAQNPGLTFLASTGDGGAAYGPIYPSISPLIVGVGGTIAQRQRNTWSGETAWSGGGGGVAGNPAYTTPAYQLSSGQSLTGYSQRTSARHLVGRRSLHRRRGLRPRTTMAAGYGAVGGTSLSSPTWAGLITIANQGAVLGGHDLGGPTQTLPALYAAYQTPTTHQSFHDIIQGNNGLFRGSGIRPRDRHRLAPGQRHHPLPRDV